MCFYARKRPPWVEGGGCAPSMRRKIDVAGIYAKVVRALPETMDGQPPLPLPEVCPVALDDLLSGDP